MKFQSLLLLSSIGSFLLVSSPAEAAKLQNWRFDANQNRLEFITDGGVQPKAQLIANPTRLVIDLPGTTLGRSSVKQQVGGAIREVRAGQLDSQTARIVVELAPSYTLDPQQIKFRGITASQWSVQLPKPEPIASSSVSSPSGNQSRAQPPVAGGNSETLPQGLQVTRDGFFVRTSRGKAEKIEVKRSRDRQTIEVESEGVSLPSTLANREVAVNRYGVREIGFSQGQKASDKVRITLKVNRDSPDWLASFSNVGGLVLLPRGISASQIEGSSGQVASQPLPGLGGSAPAPINISVPSVSTVPAPLPERFPPETTSPPVTIPSTPKPPVTIPSTPKPPTSLPRIPNSRIVVMIDPGHGGKDPGAIGIGGLRETDIVLSISNQVAAILEKQGVQAVLTRSNDQFVSLQGRVDMADRANANLFVSIHANAISMSRPDVNGLETYYYESGQRLAQTIHNSIAQNVDIKDRGVRRARFYVLRNTSMPAVLVEVGFVTGAQDARNLSNPAHRTQMAEAIAQGILRYVQQNR